MLRVFEAFAGVGSQRMALRNLGVEHKVVAISEIDKYAIQSYEAIHGETLNLGDISKLKAEDIPEHDLFTYSFPCQDISISGKRNGLEEGTGTRSSLLWECKRVIENKKPKYLLLENVKNLVGKKFKPHFDEWMEYLTELGYTNYWQVLNAKNYGIPQNRERVFLVSVLGEHEPFKFKDKMPLNIALKDLLENGIDEKYYLSQEIQDRFMFRQKGNVIGTTAPPERTVGQRDRVYSPSGIMASLTATDYKQPKQIIETNKTNVLGNLVMDKWSDQMKRIYDINSFSPTLDTMQGGQRQPKVLVKNNVENSANPSQFRIRKLTPLECWRLMGFLDEDFYKAQELCSNSQLYKQAGNSIVVNVLEGIFENLFK